MDEQVKIDVLELLEQTVDASIDAAIRECMEKEPNAEYLLALYDLMCEYGLHGRRGIEFINKLSALEKLLGGNNDG